MFTLAQFMLNVVFPNTRTIRSGWEDREVKGRLESVFEHSGSLGITAVYINLAKGLGLSNEKLWGMAFVHDLHESLAGDPSPFRLYYTENSRGSKVSFFEKATEIVGGWIDWETRFHEADKKAVWEITQPMAPSARKIFRRWWRWYYGGRIPEAKLLRQLHSIVDVARAVDYRSDPENKEMLSSLSFLEQARQTVINPLLRKDIDELEELLLESGEAVGS